MTTAVPAATPPRVIHHHSLSDASKEQRPTMFSSPLGASSPVVKTKTSPPRPVKSTPKSHSKKLSWEAFDPLLAAGDVGTGVWGNSPEKDDHPLRSKKNPLVSPPRPPKSHRKSKSSQHRKTNSADGLREIAQQLAKDKPAAFVAEQEQLVNTWADKRRKTPSSPLVVRHRHTQSLGTDMMVNNYDDGLVRTESKSLPTTPEKKSRKNANILTPPHRWSAIKTEEKGTPPPPPPPEMPTLTPLHGFLTYKDNLTLRSSEQDPSLHQVEIPPCDDFLMHSRLCAVLDQYRVVDQNFDFGVLTKTSRMALQGFVSSGNGLQGLIPEIHTPIVQSLLECSSDDLVLEGFFSQGNSSSDRVEAAVYNSQSRRQFVVVYRGTTDQQNKPVRNHKRASSPIQLHADQPVNVFPAFRDTYFRFDQEGKVFGLLDQLSEQYPFCDVVFAGHAFGGALATIAALRFASAREMLRVSCHAFGSPKVGTSNFRALVNSQSNLKVMRIEHANDTSVMAPDAHAWTHAGHSIVVNPDRKPPAAAYRFDKSKPVLKNFLGLTIRGDNKLPKLGDNKSYDIQAYVKSMEQFARQGLAWVKQYVGQDVGAGVRGKGNEKRQMV